jgi:hypothetical protein
MKNTKLGIVVLSITAAILLAAILLVGPQQPRAQGMVTIKDRDYQVLTAPLNGGGEALYITDIRTQQTVVFTYDNRTQSVEPRAKIAVADLFK